ncbi:helix-turn-helix transcriptional regulator [Congzhengia sp.]|uniref:helix-turn-helix domain-containing protein n=1 Tax=Congzhengia sp. TaxID=2944168 RepID=UPI003077570D
MNVPKLKRKIAEKNYNISTLSKTIGIDKSTFYRKTRSNSPGFSIREVKMISNALELTGDEINSIFFV